jgi:hypothetical protein
VPINITKKIMVFKKQGLFRDPYMSLFPPAQRRIIAREIRREENTNATLTQRVIAEYA